MKLTSISGCIMAGMIAAAAFLAPATPAMAQDFNYVPGHMNTYNMMRHAQPGYRAEPRARRPSAKRQRPATARRAQSTRRVCSADSLPAAERRRMEARYVQIARREGRAAADAYVRAEGMRYHRRLQRQGICP